MAGEKADWSLEAQLLAAVFDSTRQHVWLTAEVNRDHEKGRNPFGDRPPAPLPRPGLEEAQQKQGGQPLSRRSALARLGALEREREWLESQDD